MKQSAVNQGELAGLRETVESIWIAIILAFVLRAFVIEAFVIPTGSMAPRLMGQHQLARCHECGTEFPVGIHTDGSIAARETQSAALCPNCRERVEPPDDVRSGDRVLVLKYLYDFRQPRRWDVVVFKDPQSNELNYIKRLAGLPGEVVRIIHGDVFFHPIDDTDGNGVRDEHDVQAQPVTRGGVDLTRLTDWQIARKPHDTQQAMWQMLFDNDYRPALGRRRVPWEPLWQGAGDATGWDLAGHDGRVFRFASTAEQGLRFAEGLEDVFLPDNAYNGQIPGLRVDRGDVCSDLKLQTTVLPQDASGRVRLTLSHFEHEFAGEFHADGRIRLLHRTSPEQDWSAAEVWGEVRQAAWEARTAVPIALSHADWQATVWLDDQPVLTSDDRQYRPDVDELVQRVSRTTVPAPRVGIAAAGGKLELWHTRVWRDVYYICPALTSPPPGALGRYAQRFGLVDVHRSGWGTTENPLALRAHAGQPELDEFFMLGDNSPASKDSRVWVEAAPSLRLTDASDRPLYRLGTVPRYNLIGRAFFVYWPAGGNLLPPDKLPFVPNVGKMRRIH